MGKILVLIRHAHAEENYPGGKDKLRELNDKGMVASLKLGRALKEAQVPIERMVYSTAKRASETARLVAEQYGLEEERLQEEDGFYSAHVRELLDYVCNLPDSLQAVALVGHNPAWTYFLEFLVKETLHFPKAGAAVIELYTDHWQDTSQGLGKLQATFGFDK